MIVVSECLQFLVNVHCILVFLVAKVSDWGSLVLGGDVVLICVKNH